MNLRWKILDDYHPGQGGFGGSGHMTIKGFNIPDQICTTDLANLSKRNKELEDEVSRLKAKNSVYKQLSSSMSKVTAEFNVCSYELDQVKEKTTYKRNAFKINFDRMNWKYYHDRLYNSYGKFLVKYSLKLGSFSVIGRPFGFITWVVIRQNSYEL